MYKTAISFFKKHPVYNALVHLVAGAGIGILIAYPVVGAHPLRWGIILLMVVVLGYLPPLTGSK
ncbi:MAG: hypothetical protein V1697_01775 [Candidatus Levyibacteriota bacterium]